MTISAMLAMQNASALNVSKKEPLLDADMFISDDGKSLDAFNEDENTSSLKASKDSPSYIDNVNPSLT